MDPGLWNWWEPLSIIVNQWKHFEDPERGFSAETEVSKVAKGP
jgi:hypothetical protein